jgi:hypothetical protein
LVSNHNIEAIWLQVRGAKVAPSSTFRESEFSHRAEGSARFERAIQPSRSEVTNLGAMASLLHRSVADNHVSIFNLPLAIC